MLRFPLAHGHTDVQHVLKSAHTLAHSQWSRYTATDHHLTHFTQTLNALLQFGRKTVLKIITRIMNPHKNDEMLIVNKKQRELAMVNGMDMAE